MAPSSAISARARSQHVNLTQSATFALLGDAAFNLTAMPHHQIITPWEAGFGPGGCPVIEPAHCEGTQCGDRKKPAQLQASPVEAVRAAA